MKRLMTIGLAAALTVASLTTLAAEPPAPPSPEQVAKSSIETRQGVFKLISFYFGPVGGMLRGAPFDAAVVARNAPRIEALAGMIPDVFQGDTQSFHGTLKTRALEGIWTGQADFKAKSDDLVKAAGALAAAAKTGDQAATLTAARGVGAACAGCHDNYRAK